MIETARMQEIKAALQQMDDLGPPVMCQACALGFGAYFATRDALVTELAEVLALRRDGGAGKDGDGPTAA